MITPDNRYYRQVQLLVRILPHVAAEPCFALKGGTAINLFIRDLPRLSVDIDLAYLPVDDYDTSLREINAALNRIGTDLTVGSPSYGVTVGANDGTGLIDTLNVTDGTHTVKIEVNPVLRGSVNEPVQMTLRPSAQDAFGFAQITTLAFEDIYAGKLMAALDRQHPRDLFDVMVLLENEGISERLFKTWVAYLVGHKGSMADTLDPTRKDIEALYRGQFLTMTTRQVSLEQLHETRENLFAELRGRFGASEKAFLLSVKRGKPRWELLGVTGVETLPAVRWKLLNLNKMSLEARQRAIARLENVLSRIE